MPSTNDQNKLEEYVMYLESKSKNMNALYSEIKDIQKEILKYNEKLSN